MTQNNTRKASNMRPFNERSPEVQKRCLQAIAEAKARRTKNIGALKQQALNHLKTGDWRAAGLVVDLIIKLEDQ